ncbi:MAG: purine-nucleoside phosphorylase [Prevotellaceae bacterium]|jgi:purine-nucleoside phosphorylase|nr:purine-nucleoside phosphorylase [Prevotellaceae bacterium]
MDERVVKFKETADFIVQRTATPPEIGIVLGSGLGTLADSIEQPIVMPYSEVPHFVHSTAIGHKGNLIFGTLGGKSVLAMQGRFHYYEGYAMEQITFPVRVMALLGIKALFVSNAAGSVNPAFHVGDLMIIRDHINLLPNPLIGRNIDEMGPRFPDMTRPYDPGLIQAAEKIAAAQHIKLHQGVYLASAGPTYETPAEYAYFGKIGADAVAMSTTPEVIVARHSNIPVFGMSVITNEAHHFSADFVNIHADVVEAADKAAKTMSFLFRRLIEQMG